MAAASKKKQDELNLKVLRELTALEHNKKCLECGQRGITYADMTTAGFVCVQCSGYLRGINPPHRVKSISMTSFSDKEITQLKEGGNEVARKVWMGTWNPSRDREPDKKEEQLFKQFLITKYERKQWYKSPAEVKREEATPEKEVKVEAKIQPPPASKASARPHAGSISSTGSGAPLQQQAAIIKTCTAPTTPTPSTAVATPTSGTSAPAAGGGGAQPKMDLLGDLGGDPFAPRKPVGAVSVLPVAGLGGAAPLLPANGPAKQDDFGAFTGASSATSSSTTSLTLQPSNPTGDKYAELASLDSTLKELRLKEEPSPLLSRPDYAPQQQPVSQPFGGAGTTGGFGGGGPGSTNPFASPPASGPGIAPAGGMMGQQSNPFMTGGGAAALGQAGMMGPGQFGGGVAPGGFGQQPGQMQGGFGGQQMQPQQQQQQFRPQGQFPGQQPQQQWGQQPQQQQMPQQGFGMQQQHQPGGQMQWGAQPQQQQQPPQQQQQWGAPQGAQFPQGGMGMGMQQQQPQQQGFGGFAGQGGFPQQQQQQAMPNQQFGGGFGFGNQPGMQQQMPQQQQQPPQQQQQQQKPQFDWSGVNVGGKQSKSPNQFSWSGAAASQAQQPPSQPQKKYINWGGGANRVDNTPTSGSFASTPPQPRNDRFSAASTAGGSGGGGGWSNSLTKAAPSWNAPSQQQQQQSANPMGWSFGGGGGGGGAGSVVGGGGGAGGGGGWGSGFGQQQQPQQAQPQQQQVSMGSGFGGGGFGGAQQGQMGGANPFASMSSQSGSATTSNPFL